MSQFLKSGATKSKRGVTLIGDGLGNQGILSVMRFDLVDRVNKIARVVCYWWVDMAHKDKYLGEPFDSLIFNIEGDDFDEYIVKEPQDGEDTMYLLMYKRAYDYISAKRDLYLSDPGNPDYEAFSVFADIVDDPKYIK